MKHSAMFAVTFNANAHPQNTTRVSLFVTFHHYWFPVCVFILRQKNLWSHQIWQ